MAGGGLPVKLQLMGVIAGAVSGALSHTAEQTHCRCSQPAAQCCHWTVLQEGKDIRFGDWTLHDVAWLNTVNVSCWLWSGWRCNGGSWLAVAAQPAPQPFTVHGVGAALTSSSPLRSFHIASNQQFLTAKPVVYLVNLSERDYQRKKNKWLPKLFEWVQVRSGCRCRRVGWLAAQRQTPPLLLRKLWLLRRPACLSVLKICSVNLLPQKHGGDPIIPFSGALEAKLLDMPEDERETYCKEVRLYAAISAADVLLARTAAGRLDVFLLCRMRRGRCCQDSGAPAPIPPHPGVLSIPRAE